MLPAIQTPYEPEVRYMERALELAELAAADEALRRAEPAE